MDEKRGLMLVLFTAVISGFSIFVNKFGVSGMNPYVFTFAKNILVGGFLVGVLLMFKEFSRIRALSKSQWMKLGVIGLVGGSVPFLLFFKGLTMTSAGMAAFLHKTMFVYVAILAAMFLKEKVSKWIILGGLLLLSGNFLLLKMNALSFNIGDAMILSATLLWAGEIILSKHLLKEIDGTVVAAGRMMFGSAFILGFLGLTGNIGGLFVLSRAQWSWVMVTSMFLLLYVFTFYNGLKLVKATTATSVLLLGSVITTMLSFGFLGDVLSISQVIGMLLVLSGVIAVVFMPRLYGERILVKA